MSEPVPGAPTGADPAGVFAALAEIVYRGSSIDEVYSAICVAATLLVPSCDHASILMRRGGRYRIAAASDGIARRIDEMERELGEGPCLDAIEDEAAQIDTDLAVHSTWPRLATRILAETPVRGAMGFRLLVDDRKEAALNLFSDTPNAFDTAAAERAVMLAAFASVTVNAVIRGEDVSTLQRGLDSNREIGKAIGMLMLLNSVSDVEAFDMLRRVSQETNVKLAKVAAEVIAGSVRLHPGSAAQ
ncbi:GAF and ANTAR domain-containing protein [Mycobacterium sp. 1274756.6]|uniref:GAF and ANTAR domain-containing protein n=1 Tax=Mycobacterium sp. 1274756.6 TaxID=1834076 RepID=UPI0007FEFC3B|nr:GAF and ANTAR domain-containing protein [Mycobacterium sp. 1274756.6]OBJ69152.1 antitermination regulator [Mycobacterium sp. 1274756.6]